MRSPAAERTLRRLVANLAAASAEDIELVLDALEPRQREEVRALLGAYSDPGPAASTVADVHPVSAPEPPLEPDTARMRGLSPWLADRVAGRDPRGGSARSMTAAAVAALGECIDQTPQEAPSDLAPARLQGRRRGGPFGWMGRAPWA